MSEPLRRAEELEPVTLNELLAGHEPDPLENIVIVEDKPKRKAKPKRKPKPQVMPAHLTRYLILAIIVLMVVLGVAFSVLSIATVQETELPAPVEVVNPAPDAAPLAVPSNPPVGQWMQLTQNTYDLPANTLVYVLSKDPDGEYYNVADSNGTLALVTPEQFAEPSQPVPADQPLPVGPFQEAIGQMDKLVIVLDKHGDILPGTPVYVQGWRVEDGTWIYQVSQDLVKPEYVPAGFLKWIDEATMQ